MPTILWRANMKFLIFAAAAAIMFANSAQAATIFTDRAAFDVATTGSTSQPFPTSASNTADLTYTFENVTFDTTSAGIRIFGMGWYYQDAAYLAAGRGGSITISSTLNAIGLYLGSLDGAQSFDYTVNGTAGTFTTLNSTDNRGRFIGFSDTSPINVTFDLSNNSEFDVVSYVTTSNAVIPPTPTVDLTSAVPEPATWAMMILGFGLVGGAMRRRKHQVFVRYA
jgi:hypothetical protein